MVSCRSTGHDLLQDSTTPAMFDTIDHLGAGGRAQKTVTPPHGWVRAPQRRTHGHHGRRLAKNIVAAERLGNGGVVHQAERPRRPGSHRARSGQGGTSPAQSGSSSTRHSRRSVRQHCATGRIPQEDHERSALRHRWCVAATLTVTLPVAAARPVRRLGAAAATQSASSFTPTTRPKTLCLPGVREEAGLKCRGGRRARGR